MAFPQAFIDLIDDGPWASDANAQRESFADLGIDVADGYPVSYEQLRSGKVVERTGWNEYHHRLTAALGHIGQHGVAQWNANIDYVPTDTAACFVTTPTGLWLTRVSTGPRFGNAVSPDVLGQSVWRRY